MKTAVRFGALAGALAAGSLTLSACDASPYAATVNGHTITVTAFNQQLREWSANQAWVKQFDAQNATSRGGSGATVAGAGGPGTYSSAFAADILQDLVDTTAIDQHLSARGIDTTQDQTVAARAVNEYLNGAAWTRFSPQLRTYLVDQLASEGALAPVPTDTSTLQQPYTAIQPYLFFTLCVNQESAFDKASAQAIISAGKVRGVEVCYDQQSLEGQSAAYQDAARKLTKPGDVSTAIPASYGYTVVQLVSRTSPGLAAGVKQVISAATNPPAALTGIVDAAKVTVNPRYGTWSKGQVTPPKAPLSS
jgi:hypothetical protein